MMGIGKFLKILQCGISIDFVKLLQSTCSEGDDDCALFLLGSYNGNQSCLRVYTLCGGEDVALKLESQVNAANSRIFDSCLDEERGVLCTALSDRYRVHSFDKEKRTMACRAEVKVPAESTIYLCSVNEDVITLALNYRDISIYSLSRSCCISEIKNADCTTITYIGDLDETTLISTNSVGHINLWDKREKNERPFKKLRTKGLNGIYSIAQNPFQDFILVSGYENGSIGFWDLRNEAKPLYSLVEAHASVVSSIKFCESANKLHLYSSSYDGSLWDWKIEEDEINDGILPYLPSGKEKHEAGAMNILSSLQHTPAINSIDANSDLILAATDSGFLYYIPVMY